MYVDYFFDRHWRKSCHAKRNLRFVCLLMLSGPSNVPRIEVNLESNDEEYANQADVIQDGGTQPEVEIPLPIYSPMKPKSIISQWFEKFEDPIPGLDGEMEELVRL